MLAITVFFAALAVASAQTCASVTCAQMLAFSSQPVDGSYPKYSWQCATYMASDLIAYITATVDSGEQCTSGLSCGCSTGACNQMNQCPSLGCTTDNGGCSSICSYNGLGDVVCSCEAGQTLINQFQCNCNQFMPYPQAGWATATNYLCANSSMSTTGDNVTPAISTGAPASSTGVGASGEAATTASVSVSGAVSGSASTTGQAAPAVSTTGQAAPAVSTTGQASNTPVSTGQASVSGSASTTGGYSSSTVTYVRLAGSVANFTNVAQLQYVEGIAGFLGISTSRVGIASIQSGSVIVGTTIAPPPAGSNEKSSSDAVNQLVNANQATLSVALGTQVLGVSTTAPSTQPSATTATPTPASTSSTSGRQDDVQNPPSTGHHGLSGGAIAGIVIGSVVGVIIVAALIVFLIVHYASKNRQQRGVQRVPTTLPMTSSQNSINSLHSHSQNSI